MVEVLRCFRGLNLLSFTNLWFVEVSRGFWAWFQQTLGSRQIIWMILLRVFFDFDVEVLEGFEVWFLQSFCTSESLVPFQPFFSFSPSLPNLFLKCLRKASIYRSLGVGERHLVESDWWHMSQPDWPAYVIAYTCKDCLCHRLHMRWCVIGFCMTLGKFPLASE